MIYNIPPICRKPFTVFDGVVRGNGEVYTGNYQFTNTFKMQVKEGVDPPKLVAGYASGAGYTCIGQFNGFVQLFGSSLDFGASDGDGSKWNPWGIYINSPVQLSGKKKLIVNAAHCYYNSGGGVVLTNDAPICIYLFDNIYKSMYSNNVLSVEVASRPAFSNGIFDYDKEIYVPDPEELVLDVSNISGECYVGFSVDRSKSSISNSYYLNIGEIMAF